MTAFADAEGATPLDPDEARGLIPAHIATQADLNAWEEANILQGARWAGTFRGAADAGEVAPLLRFARS